MDNLIKLIIKTADEFDKVGLVKESGELDDIIEELTVAENAERLKEGDE